MHNQKKNKAANKLTKADLETIELVKNAKIKAEETPLPPPKQKKPPLAAASVSSHTKKKSKTETTSQESVVITSPTQLFEWLKNNAILDKKPEPMQMYEITEEEDNGDDDSTMEMQEMELCDNGDSLLDIGVGSSTEISFHNEQEPVPASVPACNCACHDLMERE